MNSQQIVELLAARHTEDVFVPECRIGGAIGRGTIMDAWAMPKSWAHPAVCGYEIKVSRNDFVRDTKWRSYLDCCNLFYFVAPPGIISVAELPPEAGLLETSVAGARLFVKKKAPHRAIDIPENVFRYVIMNRCRIVAEDAPGRRISMKVHSWETELARRREDRNFGRLLGRRIGQAYRKDVLEVQCENEKLTKLMKNYDAHRAFLVKMGFDPENTYVSEWEFERRWQKMQSGVDPSFIRGLRDAADKLSRIAGELEAKEPPK